MLTPPGLLSEDAQRVLGPSISPQGDGSGELSLPWPTGETWALTGGPHIAVSGSVRNAIDFAGGSGRIVAARDGVAYYSSSCPNYIRIEHGGGWKTTYYHAINIAVGYGQTVSRGQFLGNISAQSGCGGSATGPHVHFATYLNNADKAIHGLDIGGWTVENGASAYVGCMIRVRDGSRQCSPNGQIYNDGAIGSGAPPNQPPNPPSLVSPADGARFASGGVTLTWSDNGDPDNKPRNYRDYAVVVYRDGIKVTESGWIDSTSWTANNLNAGSYEWSVVSGDGAVASNLPPRRRFTVGDAPLEILCDNRDGCFSKHESAGSWGVVQDSSTFNGHAYWTYNTQNQALDWGKWQPTLPFAGTYDVYVWYPALTSASSSVTYKVHHSGGDTNVAWNQAANAGRWNKLTSVQCGAGGSCYVQITDSTSEGTNSRRVGIDAVKFVLTATPQVSLSPLQVAHGVSQQQNASGFTPNGPLFLSIRLPNGAYHEENLQADTGGNFARLYTMPANAQIGAYTYRIQDVASGVWSNTVNYTVVASTYTISGRVTDANGNGLSDVTISDGTRMANTTSNGDYTISDVPAGSYTLTPSKDDFSFSPTSLSVTVNGDLTGRNFTATPLTFTISGRVTDANGNGLGSVTISDGTRMANTTSNGDYTISGVPVGSYTLTPSKSDFSFSPTSLSVTVNGDLT
ncbi:carboxypeptidase regulatory-like domain-containing protein, partial [Candidatus Chloroploca sp. M-50]